MIEMWTYVVICIVLLAQKQFWKELYGALLDYILLLMIYMFYALQVVFPCNQSMYQNKAPIEVEQHLLEW